MTYRTILVHLNDKRRAEALLEPTIALARRHNAHLIGLHVYASMPAPPVAVPYASKALASVRLVRSQGVGGDCRHLPAHDIQATICLGNGGH
jgi:nucleotide-binding universal stress UspA family protein